MRQVPAVPGTGGGLTRETACEPVGEGDRSCDATAALIRLGEMVREGGWQPSDAQVRELAWILADRMPSSSAAFRNSFRAERATAFRAATGLRTASDRGTIPTQTADTRSTR